MKKLTCALFMLLTACVSSPKHYEKLLDTWIGTNADQLAWVWGPPASTYPLSGGRRLLTYSNASTSSFTIASQQLQMASTTYETKACTTHFLVDSSNVISGWSWAGNNCSIPDPDKKIYRGEAPPTSGRSRPRLD